MSDRDLLLIIAYRLVTRSPLLVGALAVPSMAILAALEILLAA